MNNVLYKNKYRSGSLRLRGFNYSNHGFYYVTICTKNRWEYFGIVKNDQMNVNELGDICKSVWNEITNKFENVQLDEFVIMPDHIHGIIVINSNRRFVINHECTKNKFPQIHPMGSGSLGEIVRWFKGRCTFEIRKKDEGFSWQRNYYERIIRDDAELNRIRKYIRNNPKMLKKDRNNI
jgi:REP element-mobilizing transposase RayT